MKYDRDISWRKNNGASGVRLVAVDLDGTLFTDEGSMHPDDVRVLQQLPSLGVRVSVVTGRLYSGTRHVAHRIGVLGPVACVDGSHILDTRTDNELFHAPMAGATAHLVRGVLEEFAPSCFVFAHDQIVHDSLGDAYVPYVQTWSKRIIRCRSATRHPHWEHPKGVIEVVCVGQEETIQTTVQALTTRAAGLVQAVGFPLRRAVLQPIWGMVVRAAGCSKGTAVRWLADRFGYDLTEVAAIGDWRNDIPMFAEVGRSFAMGQAPDDVRATVTDVLTATSATGGGIAEAVRRMGLLT